LAEHKIHAVISGPVVMIGFGSIGRGTLPLLERHFRFDKSRMVIIDPHPEGENEEIAKRHGVRFIRAAVTRDNYRELLAPLLTEGAGQGFCINLSVDTSSLDIMRLCRDLGVLYIDTVVEPWLGFYFDNKGGNAARTNYSLREAVMAERRRSPGGVTAVSCCGANPGMVSWFVKHALMDVAKAVGIGDAEPAHRDTKAWAALMHKTGVKGIHIAERDTQRTRNPKPIGSFLNTWSVEGFISEGLQPAELGWGSHETWKPKTARTHRRGNRAGIYLEQPGANTRVRTWVPAVGPQYGFLVTHNEAISISDHYTVRDARRRVVYRPTCNYAYHPSDAAVLSLHEMFGAGGKSQPRHHVLDEDELIDGADELGVLLYGHRKNAYWFGSRLTLGEARVLAPYQNATGLQVTSAVMAGMVWALENPAAGIVEADEMDHRRCLDIQSPYLGSMEGHFTDWTPLEGRPGLFDENIDPSDPWQFRNILVQ
jgi:homospermidine synthase